MAGAGGRFENFRQDRERLGRRSSCTDQPCILIHGTLEAKLGKPPQAQSLIAGQTGRIGGLRESARVAAFGQPGPGDPGRPFGRARHAPAPRQRPRAAPRPAQSRRTRRDRPRGSAPCRSCRRSPRSPTGRWHRRCLGIGHGSRHSLAHRGQSVSGLSGIRTTGGEKGSRPLFSAWAERGGRHWPRRPSSRTICSGVARSLPWPIASDCASASRWPSDRSASGCGKLPAASSGSSMPVGRPKPNPLGPGDQPVDAQRAGVMKEIDVAAAGQGAGQRHVAVAHPLLAKDQAALAVGRVEIALAKKGSSGSQTSSSNRAMAVRVLKTEPGGIAILATRSTSG